MTLDSTERVRERILHTLRYHPDATISIISGQTRPYDPKWRSVLETMVASREVIRDFKLLPTAKGGYQSRMTHRLPDPS